MTTENKQEQSIDVNTDVTHMHIERPVDELTLHKPTSMHKAMMDAVSDGNEHSIKDFLARPYIVTDYSWSVASGAGSELFYVKFPNDILTANLALAQKASGFLGLRATMVLRMQVNANRFQQGRLLMTFFPGDDVLLSKHRTSIGSVPSLLMQTQLPRVEFDVATDSDVVFRIPYISPYLAYNTTDGTGYVGHVGVKVYSPLASVTASDSAEITVWGHFEDVELMFPTISNSSYILQSGSNERSAKKRKDPITEEAKCQGPISSHIQRISRISNILAEVPLLSSVAAPVGWFTGIAANAISSMGFANPRNADQSAVVTQKIYDKACNVDGRDNSHSLGLFADNHLELMPDAAGNDVDEMSLKHVLSKYAFIHNVAWTTSQAPYSVVDQISCAPRTYTQNCAGVGSYTIPLSYFANYFQLYHGGIKFKFKLVKTEFHSGRIGVAFIPGYIGGSVPTVASAANMAYLHKDIHDIRTATQFEFTVPYAATTPWTQCKDSFGSVVLFVVNTLRAPPTVVQSVDILVEVAAADDWQFARPVNTNLVPFLLCDGANFQSGNDERPVEKISEETNERSAQPDSQPDGIGTSVVLNDAVALPSRFCVGEIVTSLRQLIKRSTPYMYVYNAAPSGSNVMSTAINPWMNWLPLYTNTGTPTWSTLSGQPYAMMVDYLTIVASCYTFSRGGVRVRVGVLGQSTTVDCSVQGFYPYPASLFAGPPAALSDTSGTVGASGAATTSYTQLLSPSPMVATVYPRGEFQCPYQSQLHMRYMPVDQGNIGTAQAVPTVRPTMKVMIQDFRSAGKVDEYMIHRQAADDFSCHFWSGTPPLVDLAVVSPGYSALRPTY